MGAVRAATIALVVTATAAAQHQFAELAGRGLPRDDDNSRGVARGDIDGDGDVDLVVTNVGSPNRLYLNDGAGVFSDASAGRLPSHPDDTTAAALCDVDADGDLDLVLANFGQNRLLLNDGTGAFADATLLQFPPDRDPTRALTAADFDADGDLDIALGNDFRGQDRLYLNDGTGRFSDATATWMPTESDDTPALAAADIDADGDLDLVLGGGMRPIRLYFNNGNRTFVDGTAGRAPDLTQWWPWVFSITVGDADQDGDFDVVVGSFGENMLLLNTGLGVFSDATAARLPRGRAGFTGAVVLADVDGDRDLDLFMANGRATGGGSGQNRLLANDGSGNYADTAGLPFDDAHSRAAVFADVDADGDLDLVAANGPGPNQLCINDGSGGLIDATAHSIERLSDVTLSMAAGDVDGDGDLDLLFGNDSAGGQPGNRLCRNDGNGTFTDSVVSTVTAHALTLGDIDGDGDLDLVIGHSAVSCLYGFGTGQNGLLLNDGTGAFSAAGRAALPNTCSNTRSVALGDVDRDGDLDLVVGNSFQQDQLLANSGTGFFADVSVGRMPVDQEETSFVVLGDVDRDGDLDMILGSDGVAPGPVRLYLNNGAGTFSDATAAQMPASAFVTHAGALGDVDGDGDLDIALGAAASDHLYLNDGAGTFSAASPTALPQTNFATTSVALGDVDGDGDFDLVRATWAQTFISLNDGTGTFRDPTGALIPDDRDATNAVALGDFDGDGDVDIVVGNLDAPNRLYTNLLRQIDTPHLLRPGQAFQLDIYARRGAPSLIDAAVPFFAAATASFSVPPFGVFGLAPTQMVQLPPVVIPKAAGVARLDLQVPRGPALAGLSGHAQALILPYPYQPRLTNTTVDVAIR